MMKTIKRVKLCLIAVLAVVFVSMSCTLVATNVKRAAAVSLGSETFVMDDTGLTLRTNNQVGPRFKVKMEKGLADRIKTENITLSFLIAPRAAFDKVNYNYETLLSAAKAATGTSAPARIQVADKAKIYEEGDYSWASLVINTGEANRTLDMSVVAYITYSDGNGSLVNRFAATDVEKVRGNLYNVVNTTALSDAVLAKDILGNSEFGWYGAGNYPIEISTTEQAEVLKNSGADFSGKVVLADSSVNIPSEISGNVKTVTEQAVGGNKAEIVLGSETSYAVDMGTLDGNVVKATIGGKAVSYADGKVTLDFDFKNRLIKHGEQTLTVTVEKDGQYTNYNKEVLIVTKEISSFNELKSVISCEANRAKFGYYRLTENIQSSDWFTSEYADDSNVWNENLRSNPELGFRGTFDGNGKTISSWFYRGGLFGVVGNGAVIKNLTINNKEYDGNKGNRNVLFGYSMMGATVDNVTVNILKGGNNTLPDKDTSGGLLTSLGGYGNTLKNVAINAVGLDIDTLFGTGCWFTYPEGYATDTYENCTVNVKSLIGLACTSIANKTVTTAVGVNGLAVNIPRVDETATDKIIVGQAYGYSFADIAEITAIKLGNSDFTAYTFADGMLTINADAFGPSDTGSKTFVVTAKNEKGYVMNFNLNVTIEFVATPVAIEGNREIVLSSGNNFSVDLGDYTNATVLAATLGGETVTYSGGTLTVTDEFKANTQKHGNQTFSVIVQKDGTYYNVTTNILVVTQLIGNDVDALKAVSRKNYGYYRLSEDVGDSNQFFNVDNGGSWNLDGSLGFRGTFDGAGHSVTGAFAANGLFGLIGNGAVIKNTVFNVYYYQNTRGTLAQSITGATIDNITINIKSISGTLSTSGTGGVITSVMSRSTTYNKVTINASGKDLNSLFGFCYNNYDATKVNVFTNCVVNAKSLTQLLGYNGGTVTAANVDELTITGA